ncbi:unnamed protein product [Caenorhabditis angaria]|uniref:protein kinase C n=1 Tax=Caenorhabditis angaria TaxID=860376 RepID=A0A9P1N406_9PELO|nr:unnamed protein product [Caenorhabditis angaria]
MKRLPRARSPCTFVKIWAALIDSMDFQHFYYSSNPSSSSAPYFETMVKPQRWRNNVVEDTSNHQMFSCVKSRELSTSHNKTGIADVVAASSLNSSHEFRFEQSEESQDEVFFERQNSCRRQWAAEADDESGERARGAASTYQQQQQQNLVVPTLLVTSTPSTWIGEQEHSEYYEYSSSSNMSGLCFQLQSGIHKKQINVDASEISLRDLRNESFDFIKEIYPDKGCEHLKDHILLYKHDMRSINILQLINTSADVTDGALVEVVLSSSPQNERIVVHPHTLFVHSYKVPTFCDFCGELLFGLVKQGLKCRGCGQNYHKRCASKIPNNCSGSKQRRPSAIPLSPSNSNMLTERRQSRRESVLEALDTARPASTLGGPPNIFVTTDDCGDPIGGNFLQMPRKDRSCSWSGRPLWMEVAEATRVKVPHTFQIHSYKRPTVCQFCKKLLKGLIRQGLQCKDCNYNCHKKCSELVAKDCPGNTAQSNPASYYLDTADDASDEREDETCLRAQTPKKKAQNVPSAPMTGAEKQAEIRPEFKAEIKQAEIAGGIVVAAENASLQSPEEDGVSAESQNIPLMRVVMSVKQMKRKNAKILKEGWIVHFTDQQNMRKKHFWRLDTKSIIMYQDESSTRYYKEIPLNEILAIHIPAQHLENRPATHLFEIQTQATIYYIQNNTIKHHPKLLEAVKSRSTTTSDQ